MNDSLETLILAGFLREKIFNSEYISIVEDTMFSSSPHKILINNLKQYVNRYNNLPSDEEMSASLSNYCLKYHISDDVKSLCQDLLARCYDITYDIEYVRDNFIKVAMRNTMSDAIYRAAEMVSKKGINLSDKDYDDIIQSIEKSISIKNTNKDGVLFNEVASNPKEYIESQNRYNKESVISSGLKALDNALLAHGTLPGELYCVSAPPGKGKTTFLTNIGACAMMTGKDVIHIFIGDNTESDGVLRYCARLTNTSQAQVMLNADEYFTNWHMVESKLELGKLLLCSYPIGVPSIADIRSFITKNIMKRGIDPKVVILDYIDNCKHDYSLGSYETMGALYAQAKNLAEELQLVCWTASQPKIEFWNSDNVGLDSLAESSKKQHVLDGLLNIVKKDESNYVITVAKLRRGRSDFNIPIRLSYETQTIREVNDVLNVSMVAGGISKSGMLGDKELVNPFSVGDEK